MPWSDCRECADDGVCAASPSTRWFRPVAVSILCSCAVCEFGVTACENPAGSVCGSAAGRYSERVKFAVDSSRRTWARSSRTAPSAICINVRSCEVPMIVINPLCRNCCSVLLRLRPYRLGEPRFRLGHTIHTPGHAPNAVRIGPGNSTTERLGQQRGNHLWELRASLGLIRPTASVGTGRAIPCTHSLTLGG